MKNNYLVFLFSFFLLPQLSFAQDVGQPVGRATQNGGLTGGGNETPAVVSTYSALDEAVDDENVKVIHISGTITILSEGKCSCPRLPMLTGVAFLP